MKAHVTDLCSKCLTFGNSEKVCVYSLLMGFKFAPGLSTDWERETFRTKKNHSALFTVEGSQMF